MELFEGIKALTFDCYGTLIDWETGILQALQPVLKRHHVEIPDENLLEEYSRLESAEERGEYKDYKSVLRGVVAGLGMKYRFVPARADHDVLVNSLGTWPPFPDTVESLGELKKRYKLAIISNTDDDLFAATRKTLGVTFDWIITAEQVKSYKPSTNNFTMAVKRIGLPPKAILHVAQSLFHDIPPAMSVGMRTVWIDRRYKEKGSGATPSTSAVPDLVVPSLRALTRLLTSAK